MVTASGVVRILELYVLIFLREHFTRSIACVESEFDMENDFPKYIAKTNKQRWHNFFIRNRQCFEVHDKVKYAFITSLINRKSFGIVKIDGNICSSKCSCVKVYSPLAMRCKIKSEHYSFLKVTFAKAPRLAAMNHLCILYFAQVLAVGREVILCGALCYEFLPRQTL